LELRERAPKLQRDGLGLDDDLPPINFSEFKYLEIIFSREGNILGVIATRKSEKLVELKSTLTVQKIFLHNESKRH